MTVNDPFEGIKSLLETQQEQIFTLQESLARKMLDLEDLGWTLISGYKPQDSEGPDLEVLHKLVPNLRDMAATNPLFVRGAQLRHAYIFGRGINISNTTKTKAEVAQNNAYNKDTLFSMSGFETLNLAMFTDGNVFIVRDEKTNVCSIIPIQQITAEITDPDDTSRVRYFLREWNNGTTTPQKRWYPVSKFKKSQIGRGKRGKINQTISIGGNRVPVAQDAVIYHAATKRQAGWTYGVPDCLAGAVWTVAYSEYLKDNAALVKALQQIAWSIQNSTKTGTSNSALAVAQPGVGGTAIMGSGNALSSVGVPSAQVNMNNGQPLAAMVATAFGVPVIALLSSPGATGGSYGAATTLDTPTIKVMSAAQDSWGALYEELLMDFGAPEPRVSFPNIVQNETYREAQAIATSYTSGLLWQDEARAGTLDLMDVPQLHEGNPKPDNFNAGAAPTDTSNPVPSQGNTGAVPGGTNQDVTDHNNDPNPSAPQAK